MRFRRLSVATRIYRLSVVKSSLPSQSHPLSDSGLELNFCKNGEVTENAHSAHATFDLKYQVIWITKYRARFCAGGS
jgi:hypothetical protein